MAGAELVQELEEQIKIITQYKDIELVRRLNWEPTTFEIAAQDIEIAMSIAADLSTMPLSHLGDRAARNMILSISEVSTSIHQIDYFKPKDDATAERNKIAANLKRVVDELLTVAGPWIAYLAYERGNFDERVKQTKTMLSDSKFLLEETKAYVVQTHEEVDRIVAQVREASASVGVATFTHEFDQEARRLADSAKKWLWAVIVLTVLTSAAAVASFFWPSLPDDANSWATLRNVVAKVSVIAILFTGTVWCGRIYRALTHQRSINRHRALSLKTFQAFVQATDDPATRDAVLMAATKSIFGNVPTGFVDERGATQDTSVNVLEIGKSANKAMPARRAGATQEG